MLDFNRTQLRIGHKVLAATGAESYQGAGVDELNLCFQFPWKTRETYLSNFGAYQLPEIVFIDGALVQESGRKRLLIEIKKNRSGLTRLASSWLSPIAPCSALPWQCGYRHLLWSGKLCLSTYYIHLSTSFRSLDDLAGSRFCFSADFLREILTSTLLIVKISKEGKTRFNYAHFQSLPSKMLLEMSD